MATKRQAPQGRPESQVLERTKTKRKLKQPPLYKVLFHNDDYTPMEFVVLVLMQIFDRSEVDATQIMLHVHNSGIGVAGLYPFSRRRDQSFGGPWQRRRKRNILYWSRWNRQTTARTGTAIDLHPS